MQIKEVSNKPFKTHSVCDIKKYVKQYCDIFRLCFFPPNFNFKGLLLSTLHLSLKAAFLYMLRN